MTPLKPSKDFMDEVDDMDIPELHEELAKHRHQLKDLGHIANPHEYEYVKLNLTLRLSAREIQR